MCLIKCTGKIYKAEDAPMDHHGEIKVSRLYVDGVGSLHRSKPGRQAGNTQATRT